MTYTFTINDFEGPLDLLLSLVKQSKMDIYEIPIKTLIDEYISFIKSQEQLNIEIASEYLVMASELLHLKSRMLINQTIEEDSDDEMQINSEEELRNKLIEYEKIKNIKEAFKDLENKRQEIYEKAPESYENFVENTMYESNVATIDDLYKAILDFQKKFKYQKPLNTKITTRELSVEDRVRDIRNILNKKNKINFLDLFEEFSKEYVIVTFLSVLDMSKNKEINIIQEDNFKPIMIEKR
ncbi:MAG: segregation/condensation protein A [Bacilli bacterium]|nr:segregation/condensation protein A [Bacilli bacterium]